MNSKLLEEAIIDAQALKEVALKNAEQAILEKYAPEVRTAIESLLEQEDMAGGTMPPLGDDISAQKGPEMNVPLAATDEEKLCPCPDEDEVITISLADLEDAIKKTVSDTARANTGPSPEETATDMMPDMAPEMMSPEEEPPEDEEELSSPIMEDIEIDEELIAAILSESEKIEEMYDDYNPPAVEIIADRVQDILSKMVPQYDQDTDVEIAIHELSMEFAKKAHKLMGSPEITADKQRYHNSPELNESDEEAKKAKPGERPDYPDVDKDGNKEESMKDALEDKEQKEVKKENKVLSLKNSKILAENKKVTSENKLLTEKFDNLLNKHKTLLKENDNIKEIALQISQRLEESNLMNAKLLYKNQALGSDSLNERQKDKIVEAVSKAGSVDEAKMIYETLCNAVGTFENKGPQSLSEAVETRGGLTLKPRQENTSNQNPIHNRWQKIAGITK